MRSAISDLRPDSFKGFVETPILVTKLLDYKRHLFAIALKGLDLKLLLFTRSRGAGIGSLHEKWLGQKNKNCCNNDK